MGYWIGLTLLLQVLATPRPIAKIVDGGSPPAMISLFTQWLRQEGYEVSVERWNRVTPIGALVYARDPAGAKRIAELMRNAEVRPLLWEGPFDLIAVLGQGASLANDAPPPPKLTPWRLIADVGFLSPLFGKDLNVASLGGRQQTTRAAPLIRGTLGVGLPHPIGPWLDLQAEGFAYAAGDHSFLGPAARIEGRIWEETPSSVSLAVEAGAAFNTRETLPGSFDTSLMWGAGATFAQALDGPWSGAFSVMYVFLSPRYGRPPDVFQASSSRIDLSGPQVSFRLSWSPKE
ncbi:MAG: hypothetical protein HYT87_13600 [Nitrospirae bacterium]|nr:hypothetical protein [Nitrospirota bacterium]